jgi:hypothetical protein
MFFGKAEAVELDSQGRLLIPQRLRSEIGVRKEVVVLGVFDRMEIWDRDAHERYEQAHGGAYQAGTLDQATLGGRGRWGSLAASSQSLSLIFFTARHDRLVSLGLLVVRALG